VSVNEALIQRDVVLEARALRKFFPTGASKMLQRPTDLVQAVDEVSLTLLRGTTQLLVNLAAENPRWLACWLD
jgi:ABC-type microcin C transport system duplicated ATPase subunit YejF